jgi:hypothetical protein
MCLEHLQLQLNAVDGFSDWFAVELLEEAYVETKEYGNQVLRVLDFYAWELERQIDGNPATQSWFDLIALSSMTVVVLKDELLTAHPEVATYRPADEPTTVHEMIAKLLSDALTLFKRSQEEMSGYLQMPEFPGLLNGFMSTVLQTAGH